MSALPNPAHEAMANAQALILCAACSPTEDALAFLYRAQDALDTAVLLTRESVQRSELQFVVQEAGHA